ncbi:hypothetical protein AYI69_g4174 [Smittium culicis]|uniref:Uncharacterized protein n=1 Tax=Smittium culicis TaxID=133412 RepID=A0A1R1YFX6_9FUNG|nr:hypothetical protein AYI69_g4174 [Smittium culicis]
MDAPEFKHQERANLRKKKESNYIFKRTNSKTSNIGPLFLQNKSIDVNDNVDDILTKNSITPRSNNGNEIMNHSYEDRVPNYHMESNIEISETSQAEIKRDNDPHLPNSNNLFSNLSVFIEKGKDSNMGNQNNFRHNHGVTLFNKTNKNHSKAPSRNQTDLSGIMNLGLDKDVDNNLINNDNLNITKQLLSYNSFKNHPLHSSMSDSNKDHIEFTDLIKNDTFSNQKASVSIPNKDENQPTNNFYNIGTENKKNNSDVLLNSRAYSSFEKAEHKNYKTETKDSPDNPNDLNQADTSRLFSGISYSDRSNFGILYSNLNNSQNLRSTIQRNVSNININQKSNVDNFCAYNNDGDLSHSNKTNKDSREIVRKKISFVSNEVSDSKLTGSNLIERTSVLRKSAEIPNSNKLSELSELVRIKKNSFEEKNDTSKAIKKFSNGDNSSNHWFNFSKNVNPELDKYEKHKKQNENLYLDNYDTSSNQGEMRAKEGSFHSSDNFNKYLKYQNITPVLKNDKFFVSAGKDTSLNRVLSWRGSKVPYDDDSAIKSTNYIQHQTKKTAQNRNGNIPHTNMVFDGSYSFYGDNALSDFNGQIDSSYKLRAFFADKSSEQHKSIEESPLIGSGGRIQQFSNAENSNSLDYSSSFSKINKTPIMLQSSSRWSSLAKSPNNERAGVLAGQQGTFDYFNITIYLSNLSIITSYLNT